MQRTMEGVTAPVGGHTGAARPSTRASSRRGAAALLAAATSGDAAAIQRQLHDGIIRQQDIMCNDLTITPLMMACCSPNAEGRPATVKLLLQLGASICAPGAGGFTPLIVAAEMGHLDVVNLLVTAKAGVDHVNNDGMTALSAAAQGGCTAVVSALLAAGAAVDGVALDRLSPLCETTVGGHTETALVLIRAGADVGWASSHGECSAPATCTHPES